MTILDLPARRRLRYSPEQMYFLCLQVHVVVTAAVAAVVVMALVVIPVCAPAKKTITGFSPKTLRLTHLKEYFAIPPHSN